MLGPTRESQPRLISGERSTLPVFPTSGRIFDGSSFYHKITDQKLILHYSKQISSSVAPILTPTIIKRKDPPTPKKVRMNVGASSTWKNLLFNYQLRKQQVAA